MKLEKAIEILKEHNEWRRGTETQEPTYSPTEIGLAIDAVIDVLESNKLLLFNNSLYRG